MENKSVYMTISLSSEQKKKLKEKAETLGLGISKFIQKVSDEEIIFLDENIKKFTSLISFKEKKKK